MFQPYTLPSRIIYACLLGLLLPGLLVSAMAADQKVLELEWEELIPPDWRPDTDLIFKYNNGEIGDDDPRIILLRKKLKQLEKLAPTNRALNNKRVKLPGFVVPLEADAETISEFLLVPYHGACIHVPPPPSNQIVHVKSKPTKRGLMETVWITGILTVKKNKNKIAETGYVLHAEKIETQ